MARPRGKNVEYDSYMSAEQLALYAQVERRAERYRDARVNGEARLRAALKSELAMLRVSLESAVLDAWEPYGAGETPKRGLKLATLKRAYGTSDSATITDIVSKWVPVLHAPAAVGPEYTLLTIPKCQPNEITRDDPAYLTVHYLTIAGERVAEGANSGAKLFWDQDDKGWEVIPFPNSVIDRELTKWYAADFNAAKEWQQNLAGRAGKELEAAK